MSEWFCANKLSLNVNKTNVMIFNRNEDKTKTFPDLFLGGKVIKRVSNNSETPAVRMLGIWIDSQLNFDFYLKYTIKKINSSIFVLNRIKSILPEKCKILLYYALIHSHLHFSSFAIAMGNRKNRETLFKCQKRALRIISNKKSLSHSVLNFEKYDILPLPCLISYNIIKLMLQIKHGSAPPTLSADSWIPKKNTTYNLRDQNEYHIPRINYTSCEKLCLFYYAKIWNSLPQEIFEYTEPKMFLSEIRSYLFENYIEENLCRVKNCMLCTS